MSRITNKEANGRYYIVEEKICIGTEQINPISTWITGNENRGYGKPIDKLGKIEDLMEKYEIESVEDLEKILADYDDMAKAIVEMGLGVKVEFEEE